MTKRPNILFILVDQMRGRDMGCAGNSDVISPNLDKLAAQGALWTNAISNCPLCVPARGCILTGRHALSHRALTSSLPLPEEEVSIAELLKPLGYRTGYIGKWHLDGIPHDKFVPPGKRRHGFDYWAAWNFSHDYFNGRYYRDKPEPICIAGYEPDHQTELAINFMEGSKEAPFCLFLAWGPPHAPYHLVPQHYKGMYDTERLQVPPNSEGANRRTLADYYAQITALDSNIGRLLAALERLRIAEETILVFTSDHGDMLWSHGSKGKQQPWEESIRIPFIIRWPGRIPPRQMSDTLISLVDMMPTLLGLVEAEIPDNVEGADLSRALLGHRIEGPSSVFIYIPVPAPNSQAMEIRLDGEWRGVRTRRHTYARSRNGEKRMIFDNLNDPYQLNNLIDDATSRDLHASLESELQQWLDRTGDRFLDVDGLIKELGLENVWNENERFYLARKKDRQWKRQASGGGQRGR